nr:hypothetical protein [Anaerolineaceae bacterium]
MKEPSVLDYFKAKLNPWGNKDFEFDGWQEDEDYYIPHSEDLLEENLPLTKPKPQGYLFERMIVIFPIIISIFLGIIGQRMFEPETRNLPVGLFFYSLSAAILIISIILNRFELSKIPAVIGNEFEIRFNIRGFIVIILLLLGSFLSFSGNQFASFNLFLWFLCLGWGIFLFWERKDRNFINLRNGNLFSKLKSAKLSLHVDGWFLLVLLLTIIVTLFRFSDLGGVPGEMFSDHAEKLIDVGEVLGGNNSIFFPRNTGREAFQMYLTAAVSIVFGTGLSFMSLKIGTTLAGFFTLPFIYLLGKEIGNRWVGLLAFFLAGIAYWPNVISRVGLRFPHNPLFVAP